MEEKWIRRNGVNLRLLLGLVWVLGSAHSLIGREFHNEQRPTQEKQELRMSVDSKEQLRFHKAVDECWRKATKASSKKEDGATPPDSKKKPPIPETTETPLEISPIAVPVSFANELESCLLRLIEKKEREMGIFKRCECVQNEQNKDEAPFKDKNKNTQTGD